LLFQVDGLQLAASYELNDSLPAGLSPRWECWGDVRKLPACSLHFRDHWTRQRNAKCGGLLWPGDVESQNLPR